jgi:hypothetical protein
VFGEDAYPDVWIKAAALLQSIVKSHSLVDGNKRLGWLATAVCLELNGVDATAASNDDVYELVMAIAAGGHDIEEVAASQPPESKAAASHGSCPSAGDIRSANGCLTRSSSENESRNVVGVILIPFALWR